ncbi:MAG: sensor histidine kinase, partial [Burkholderiales bacterium]
AIEALAERLDGLAGLSIQIRGSVPAVPIPEPVGQVLFRVVRELLVNAIKHSRATQATIEISMQGNDLTFTVQDDGVGIHSLDTRAAAHCDGFGLVCKMLRHRYWRLVGGSRCFVRLKQPKVRQVSKARRSKLQYHCRRP